MALGNNRFGPRWRRVSQVLLAMGLLATLAALPGTASAKVVWTEPGTLDSRSFGYAVVASNGAGDSVVAWRRRGNDGDFVVASARSGNGQWGAPQAMSPCGDSLECDRSPYDLVAMVDDSGRATVAWLGYTTGPNGGFGGYPLYVTQHDPRSGWSTPRLLSDSALRSPTLVADGSGAVTAVWGELESFVSYPEPGTDLISTASQTPSGEWGSPEVIDEGQSPSAAQSPDGALTVVYSKERSGGDGFEVLGTKRSPGGAWSAPETLSSVTPHALEPQTVSDAEGNVTSAWTRCSGARPAMTCVVEAASKPVTGLWGEPEVVDEQTLDGFLWGPALAVGGDGGVTAVWTAAPTSYRPGSAVRTSRRTSDGGWESPSTIAAGPVEGSAEVAADAVGNVVATWNTHSDQHYSTQAAYRPAGAGWQSPTLVGEASELDNRQSGAEVAAVGGDAFTVTFRKGAGVFFSDRVDDTTAARAWMRRPARRALAATGMRVAWSAADSEAGVARVVVRRKVATYDGGFGSWRVWKRAAGDRGGATFRGRPGRSYCFAVKAIDRAGNRGRWSKVRCAATAVDDRATRVTDGWSRVQASRAYRDTLTVTRKRGERLVLPRAKGRVFKLVATTCPSCGVVEVSLGKRDLRRVSLRSAKVRHRRVISLASFQRVHRGRVIVRVLSKGKPVRIDGIVVGR